MSGSAPANTAFTVAIAGQCVKPERTHHCHVCNRCRWRPAIPHLTRCSCVLKMDHHCRALRVGVRVCV